MRTSPTTATAELQEGDTKIQDEYALPEHTVLELKRTFDTPGLTYVLRLKVKNLHTEEDTSIFTWNVICANPVIAEDWELLEYPKFLSPMNLLSLKIKIPSDKNLPTMPELKIRKLEGSPVATNLTERTQLTEEFIPYYLTHDEMDVTINCLEEPDACVTSFVFKAMGLADNPITDASEDSYGNMIIVTIALTDSPTMGGIFGLALEFGNGISKIYENHETNEIIFEEVDMLDIETGNNVMVSTPKWQYRWIESYVDFEGPVSVKLQYKLSLASDNVYDLEFTNGKWYLPQNTIPHFTISFYTGTARRIQYTLNNTDTKGNTPTPCFKDWPPGALDGIASFTLDFCPVELVIFKLTICIFVTNNHFLY